MKVAHVSAAMHYGGAERILVDLARGHAAAGLQIAIIAPTGPLDRDWGALGIERIVVPPARRDPADLARAAKSIRSGLRAWNPDVVHAHNVKATALSVAGARNGSKRSVLSTLHGVAPHQMRVAATILRFADRVAAVSEDVCREVTSRGLQRERVEVIHNGVETIPPLDDGMRRAYDEEFGLRGPVVAVVGRLAPEKAHDRFLAAAAIILESSPDASFLIIGEGPLRAELERRTAELGIEPAVTFTGLRDDARLLIDRADVIVLSSRREGHPVAVLEALAAGTPVVSTPVTGIREVLGTGGGTIVPSGRPEEIAAAVSTLLDDPDRRRLMGEEGRKLIAERFSSRVMRERYASLYERLAR